MTPIHQPLSEEAAARLVQAAALSKTPLAIRGGGTRSLHAAPEGAEQLSSRGLSGILAYNPAEMTMTARAGTPLEAVEAALAEKRQMLAFEPNDLRGVLGSSGIPTIGGVFATNASGPRRFVAGAARDSLLGVRFVNGRGEVVKAGGRVMKNVTGLDLVKLLAGSHGTLGVLTEISVKVLPRPERVATLVLRGLGLAPAVAAMSAALCTPFQVSGAARLPDRGETWLRLEGFAGSVAHRTRALAAELVIFAEAEVAERDWTEVRDARPLAGGAAPGAVWRISVKPSDGPGVVAALGPDARWLMDWGGGLVWARVPEAFDLRAALAALAGHATLVHPGHATPPRWPALPPEAPPVAALSAALRARFDPAGRLTPGRPRGPVAA